MTGKGYWGCAAVLAAGSVLVNAHPPSGRAADEAQIGSLIVALERGEPAPVAADAVFCWPGKELVMGAGQVGATARNLKAVGAPARIVVNDARDLACDYSAVRKGRLSGSALRVWRKDGGRWQIAAEYVDPRP